MKDKAFGVLQRVGRSFMLPIALLPIAGLFLGIGSSFTNETMLQTYHLDTIITQGNLIYNILELMKNAGTIVFDNLALLFAMGVAIGMAKKEKEVAALSGAVAFLIMNVTISTLISLHGGVEAMPENTTTTVLGMTTLQMGVAGGIVVGLGVAALHNKFYRIQLPSVISFFGGSRFVPIISCVVYFGVGILFFYVWPFIQVGISQLGNLVNASGYAGSWIYGTIERALIPFGLHHVFYIPFWQTELGGSMVINGEVVQGAQNIFFAELADETTTHFSVEATRFMSGKFVFMIFGLPAAAFAMYRQAKPQKRKVVRGLLVSAAVTAMLTGITEPIEFTFLFVAPLAYGVHCVLAGLAYMLMHMLNVGVGTTFSGGIIDLTLFGIMQGNDKTSWIWIPIVGVGYAVLYYFVFTFLIRKFNLKTPGREADDEEPKLYTKDDYKAKKGAGNSDQISCLIVKGLGGKANISDVDACMTRLRITVNDSSKVDEATLKKTGASGVVRKGDGVQIIYGPRVANVKSDLEVYLDNYVEGMDADFEEKNIEVENKKEESKEENKMKRETMVAYTEGTVVPITEVKDDVFANKILGDGVAIEPTVGKIFAPADGVIEDVANTKHAVGMTTKHGAEILLHVGLDTVKLEGKYFEPQVEVGQNVKKGDLLLTFDIEEIQKAGYPVTTPLIICNTDNYKKIEVVNSGNITLGKDILKIK